MEPPELRVLVVLAIFCTDSLISLNPCNQIKQKTNKTHTVSEIKWDFKTPILNLNYVASNMPSKQKDRWEINF